MSLKQLQAQHREKVQQARALMAKIEDTTPAKEARAIEREFDATLAEADALRDQIEDMRAAQTEQGDSRRPLGEDASASATFGGTDPEEASFALRSDQRMTAWAEARKPSEYRELSLGRYLRSMVTGATTDLEKRALAEGSDSAGGYTTPTILSARLIDLLRAETVVNRAGAQIIPLTSDHHNIAAVASDPTPQWRDENASVNESEPSFRNVPFQPKSLAVLTRVSFELMQDSLNLEEQLPRIMAAALALELDRVALMGSGTAPEPRGIANTAGIGSTSHDAALTTYAPFVAARTGILTANAGPVSAFVAHPRDEGALTGLVDSDGQPLNAPRAVSEIPMLTTTAIPVDGGAGDNESNIFAGNFAHLLIGMRSEIRIEVLRERFADAMQYGLLAHMRADVAVQHAGAFHVITGVQG